MDIERSERDGIPVLTLAGTVDGRGVAALQNGLKDLVGAGARRLIVDMTKVDTVGLAGLRMLLAWSNRLQRGCLVVCAGENVRRTLEVAELDGVLYIATSVENAMRHFASIQVVSPLTEAVSKILGAAEPIATGAAEATDERLADAMLRALAADAGDSGAARRPPPVSPTSIDRTIEPRPEI